MGNNKPEAVLSEGSLSCLSLVHGEVQSPAQIAGAAITQQQPFSPCRNPSLLAVDRWDLEKGTRAPFLWLLSARQPVLTQPLACRSSPEAETSEQGDPISGLVARLEDVAVRERWKRKGEGPRGILKRGNKIVFVTSVMCCASAGLGDTNILWHLEMG